jgi:hypothetical protein
VTTIDFIWAPTCPNVKAAEGNLREALALTGRSLNYTPWRVGGDLPERLQGCASPTILIDGVDVGGSADTDPSSCRGLPSVKQILDVLSA